MRPKKTSPIKGIDSTNFIFKHKNGKMDQPVAPQLFSQSKRIPIELLQLLLNIFRDAFPSHSKDNIADLIQQVKQYLYNRDFKEAFGREEYLEAYAVRWSPSRALAYINIFCSLPILSSCILSAQPGQFNYVKDDTVAKPGNPNPPSAFNESPNSVLEDGKQGNVTRIVCIGAGGGAETVAFGGLLKHLQEPPPGQQTASEGVLASGERLQGMRLEITAIDVAEWTSIVSRLQSGITTAPQLHKYASTEAKASNRPLVGPSAYAVRFVQQDILNMGLADLAATFTDVPLITLMFTLNELYSTSISATTNLLLSLTMLLSPGALLLIVDSPGSYSTVKLGTSSASQDGRDSKRYPLQWLLDHTLLESAAIGSSINASAGGNQWEKLESRESEWFRLPEELVYPIDLEDMRYQVHLYRRL